MSTPRPTPSLRRGRPKSAPWCPRNGCKAAGSHNLPCPNCPDAVTGSDRVCPTCRHCPWCGRKGKRAYKTKEKPTS